MIIVTGAIRFASGELDRVKDALVRNVESSRGEGGCDVYAYARDLIEPDLLRIVEHWRDEAAFAEHAKRAEELLAPLKEAKVETMSIAAYDASFFRTIVGDA